MLKRPSKVGTEPDQIKDATKEFQKHEFWKWKKMKKRKKKKTHTHTINSTGFGRRRAKNEKSIGID